MKKNPKLVTLLPEPSEDLELARIVPIRTETTLTRYPFHRIAKKGDVKIKQTQRNERGKVITTWEVENPPSSLAYKIDTIVVNRRIDEMRNRGEIRQLFKLGSLSEICKELGFANSGNNKNGIREALYQNAKAFIRAKLDYKGNDSIERTFEFGTTRYTVIFTGEKLPNGKQADGVYIELHPRYHEMLRYSKTRPLDYEYLKELPPSSQRLYELLSFSMFGTLKYERPNTQMLYSEFCQSAPLTRYEDWNRVRPQMWKIHKPHIDAGYLKSVEFEETVDASGVIDWLMKYTPGRRARHEFREFTTKRAESLSAGPRLIGAGNRTKKPVKATPALSEGQLVLLAGLQACGVVEETARKLVLDHPDRVERELDAFAHRDQSKMKEPAAWLIRAIEKGNYSQPAQLQKKRRHQATKSAEARRKEIEIQFRGEYAETYLRPLQTTLAELRPEAGRTYAQMCQTLDMRFADRDETELENWKLADLETLAKERPEFGLLSFWQWLALNHPEAA